MNMPWYKRLLPRFQRKSGTSIEAMLRVASASWSARNFATLVEEGYKQNPTVKRCVQLVADSAKTCPVIITAQDGSVVEKVPAELAALLARPNAQQSWSKFIEQAFVYKFISGEAPLWAVRATPSRPAAEVWVLRPDFLTEYVTGGSIARWQYAPTGDEGSTSVTTTLDVTDVALWLELNPRSRFRGLSPLFPAAFAIDTLNEYAKANKAVLENGGTPSGVFWTEHQLGDTAFDRLKSQLREEYAGARNNGKHYLLEDGLKYQQTGLNMRDMEYVNGKVSNKLDVCEALGVPPQLIGLPGSQTFANYEQARASFYEETVIPQLNDFLAVFMRLAAPALAERYILCVDVEAVPALEVRRSERNMQLDKLSSLRVNEKREAMGYEAVPNGDDVLVPSGLVPLSYAGSDLFNEPPADAAATAGNAPAKPVTNAKPTNDATPLVADAQVQQQALNGAQMTALQSIVQAVADNALPLEAAVRLVMIAIPSITEAQARALLQPADEFEPEKKPIPAALVPGALPPGGDGNNDNTPPDNNNDAGAAT